MKLNTKNTLKIIVIIILSFFVLTGCEKKREIKHNTETTTVEEKNIVTTIQPNETKINFQDNIDKKIAEEILSVINENLSATSDEDAERVLATIHKDSPQRNSTTQGMDYVFANYDLEYVLEMAEVIEIKGNEAKVHYIQTTRALQGIGFANMRAEGIHHMKKSGNEWKIFKTENIATEQIP